MRNSHRVLIKAQLGHCGAHTYKITIILLIKKYYMSRVTTTPNSIVTVIVNNDVYHQSPLMDKWESVLYV